MDVCRSKGYRSDDRHFLKLAGQFFLSEHSHGRSSCPSAGRRVRGVTTLYRTRRVRSAADPFATALLVDRDRRLGRWEEAADDARRRRPSSTSQDAWVAPAFVDAHVHATSTGLALTGLDLTGTRHRWRRARPVEGHARAARGGVVLGTGWDETAWPERRPPTAAELDRASYGGVVYLARTDVHSAVASSALLAACPEAAWPRRVPA